MKHKGFTIKNWTRGVGIYKDDRVIDSAKTEEDAIAQIDQMMGILERAEIAAAPINKMFEKMFSHFTGWFHDCEVNGTTDTAVGEPCAWCGEREVQQTADIIPFPRKEDE